MVFAAGLGTRLKPFTLHHPKAMVEVGGIPMVRRVIEHLRDCAGVTDVIVNVHHFSDQIVEYLSDQDLGVTIEISDESGLLLDTGGGIAKARGMLDTSDNEPFIVHNADIFTTIDYGAMIEDHMTSGRDVTLLGADRNTSRYLFFEKKSHQLKGWMNISTGEQRPAAFDPNGLDRLAFGGVHVITPRQFFDRLEIWREEKGDVFSIMPFYLGNINDLNIGAWRQPDGSVWIDVGRPETLEEARALFADR